MIKLSEIKSGRENLKTARDLKKSSHTMEPRKSVSIFPSRQGESWPVVHVHLVGRSVLQLWVSILPQSRFCDGFTNKVGQVLEMKAKHSRNHVGLPSTKLLYYCQAWCACLPPKTLGLKPARLHSRTCLLVGKLIISGPFPSWRHFGSQWCDTTLDVGWPGLSSRIIFD